MIPDSLFPAVLNQIIQVSCVAVLAAIITRYTRGNRPHLVHAVWLIVFLKCITPPIVASPTSPFSWLLAAMADSERNLAITNLKEWSNESDDCTQQVPTLSTAPSSQSPTELESASAERQSFSFFRAWHSLERIAISYFSIQYLLLIWLIVAGSMFVVSMLRFIVFIQCVNRTKLRGLFRSQYSSRLNGLVASIEVKLGKRLRTRIEVVDALVGPAILGLLRPTILLPKAIVDRTSDKNLEILIAHELVHFRRGDLWWSAMQMLAVCCYWFHPVVWMARAIMNREAEKCCDEETIGTLKCDPGEYARCLISVLECKHLLRAAPLLPGVRPVDVTAKRLERIMRLRHGCHTQSPTWVRIVFLVGAIILLPGATLTLAQQQDGKPPLARAEDPTLLPLLAAQVITEPNQLESLDISDLLTKLQDTEKVSPEQAKAMLLARLPLLKSKAKLTVEIDGKKNAVTMGGDAPSITIAGNRLYAFGTEKEHDSVRAYIEHYRNLGNEYIVYNVRIVDVPTDRLETLMSQWNSGQSTDDNPIRNQPTKEDVVTASFESKPGSDTCQLKSLTADQIRELLSCEGCTIEMAPRISAFNAQSAIVQAGSEHPFIASHQKVTDDNGNPTDTYQPVIDSILAGIKLELQGTVLANDQSKLTVRFKFKQTKLLGIQTFSLEREGQQFSVQQPKVNEQLLETCFQQSLGSTVAVVGEPEPIQSVTEKQVPLLGKIPYVNRLFKNVALQSENRTKVILITSRLEDGSKESRVNDDQESENLSKTVTPGNRR